MPKTLDTPSHPKNLTPVEPSAGGMSRVKQREGREQRRRGGCGGFWQYREAERGWEWRREGGDDQRRWSVVDGDEGWLNSGEARAVAGAVLTKEQNRAPCPEHPKP